MTSATPADRDALTGLIAALELTPAVVARRRELLGLDDAALLRLVAIAAPAQAGALAFIDRLYERLLSCPATAAWLQRPEIVERLKNSQRSYFGSLFTGVLDWDHVLSCLRIGSVHHRVRLPPQWYLAAYAHWVADHVDVVFAAHTTTSEAIETIAALLRRVLIETIFVLDAYGVRHVEALREAGVGARPTSGPSDDRARGSKAAPRPPAPFSRIRVATDEVDQRAAFVGIDDEVRATLRHAAPSIEAALPDILARFCDFFTSCPETAPLVSPAAVEPLKQQVASYWRELARADFDRPYATSRTRIGFVHERIGLSVEMYLIGLAHQTTGMLRRVAEEVPDPRAFARALLRAVFFDLSFVLDAYMEARAAALLRTEGFAAELLAGITAGVAVVDAARFRVESANPALLTMFGLNAQLVRHTRIDAIIPVDGVIDLLRRIFEGREPRAVATLRSGARLFRATAVRLTSVILSSDGPRAALVLDELTDVDAIGESMAMAERGLVELTSGIRAVLWEADLATWTIQVISRPAVELTGYRDMHFLGRRGAWIDLVPEPDRASFIERCASLTPGARVEIVHRLKRADGILLWVRTEAQIAGEDGATMIRGVTVDITAELREQQNRLAALGRFAGGVAHELNNLLMVVTGSLELLQDGDLDADGQEVAAAALHASHRSAELIRKLLAFAQRQPLRSEPLLLNDVVQDIARGLSRGAGDAVRIVVELDPALWLCSVDRKELEGAIRGVIENARDAMPRGGEVTLRTRNVTRSELDPTVTGRLADHVELAVNDTGHGMGADVLSHAFDPFYTTKPSAVGLGLSSIHGFVQQSGGHVLVTSTEGSGTVVRLRFPRAEPRPSASRPAEDRPRVLIVDDDPDVRAVLVRLIGRMGVATLEAASAREALDVLESTSIDLLVTDIVLGQGMSGGDLGRLARSRRPDLPVIYVSGYTRAELDLDELGPGEWFLPKPLAPGILRETIKKALPAPRAISA